MTAREVQAAFEKNRVREADLEGFVLVLFWSIPELIESEPKWLDELLTPARVCMFQLEAFRRAVKSQAMLRMVYDNSDRLRAMFGDAIRSESYIEAGVITRAAQEKIETLFTGVSMVELDQLSAANRDLPLDKQLEYFRRASKPWVAERFRNGKLTFRMMLDRDPGNLLVKWDPAGL